MTRPIFRFLGAVNSSETAAATPPAIVNVDSDFVIILVALLCALVCVLGLIAVARCTWLRRFSLGSTSSEAAAAASRPPPKGLKKKVIRSLPKEDYTPESANKFSDCAICLTEFSPGDEIRVLPQCGHGFHVACIDMWLVSHSSCPSCRQVLVVTRCQKCGGLPGSSNSSGLDPTVDQSCVKSRDDGSNRFLP